MYLSMYAGGHGYGHGLAAWSRVSHVQCSIVARRLSTLWLPWQTTGIINLLLIILRFTYP